MELGDGYTKLVYGVNRKDEKAWQELFDSYYESLCHHAARILLDDHVAEDVVQDCFMNVWENSLYNNLSDGLDKYMFHLVKNAALNELRGSKRREVRHEKMMEHGRGPVDVFERGGIGDVRRGFLERGAGRGAAQVEGVDRFITGRTSESDLDEHGRDERRGDRGEVGRDDSYG